MGRLQTVESVLRKKLPANMKVQSWPLVGGATTFLDEVVSVRGVLILLNRQRKSVVLLRDPDRGFKRTMKVALQVFEGLRRWADRKGYWIEMP